MKIKLKDDKFLSDDEIEIKKETIVSKLLQLTDSKRPLKFKFDSQGSLVFLEADLSKKEITDIKKEHINLKEQL